MLCDSIHTLLARDLLAVRRAVEAYPDDASLWRLPAGLPNAGGTLVLHVVGNLRHFVGMVLAHTGYVRDRDAEFARRDVPRAVLLEEIDAAIDDVQRALAHGPTDAALDCPFPEPVAGRAVRTGDFLLHLVSHTAYHLGQLDYHRRVVTGDRRSVNAVAVGELPTVGGRAAAGVA